MNFTRRKRTRPHIDMTPLIDCVFTMLVVLMISATFFAPESMGLKLPQASTQDNDQKPEIVLSVDREGKYFLNERPIAAEDLVAQLRPLIDKSSTKVVTFRGDEKIGYPVFIKALDAVRTAGGVHMDILHD